MVLVTAVDMLQILPVVQEWDVYAGVCWQLQLKMMKLRAALSTIWTVQVPLVTLQRYHLSVAFTPLQYNFLKLNS